MMRMPSGTRLRRTSALFTRNSFGSRIAWLRPFINTLAVVVITGIYHMVYYISRSDIVCHRSGARKSRKRKALASIRQCRIEWEMHTVVETPGYLKDAKQAGLSHEDQQAIINFIAGNTRSRGRNPGPGRGPQGAF